MTTKPVRTVALALEYDESHPGFVQEATSIHWTPQALAILAAIREQAAKSRSNDEGEFSLPYVTLRSRLQLGDLAWVALADDVGLRRTDARATPQAFAFASTYDASRLDDIVAAWMQGPLAAYMRKYGVDARHVAQLEQLLSARALIGAQRERMRLFPWGAQVGPNNSVFKVGAATVACLLAGQEVFPGLGPCVRVIDGPSTNYAEVMTLPMTLSGGRFSLVCRISIETLPGQQRPVITTKFSRRRWVSSFADGDYVASSIGGYVIAPERRPGLAFRFDVNHKKDDGWMTDQAFDELTFAFNLAPGFANERVVNYPQGDTSHVLVMQRAGVTDDEASDLAAGVPPADQLDAFDRATHILASSGFRPLSGFSEVRVRTPNTPRIEVIKPALVLNRLLALSQTLQQEEPLASDADLELEVIRATARPLSEWFGKRPFAVDRTYRDIAGLHHAWRVASGVATDPDRKELIFLTAGHEEQAWVKSVLDLMFGGQLKVTVMRLPSGVHGARSTLPGSDRSATDRAKLRADAWRAFACANTLPTKPMVIVQAPYWYEQPSGSRYPDDRVNKQAARRTLACELGATVQYLLPWEMRRLQDYLLRLQSAALDLVYGHGGHVYALKAAIESAFATHPPSIVAAIGSIVLRGSRRRASQAILAATMIDAATGRCLVRVAHQQAERVFTEWMTFDGALGYVASRDRFQLPAGTERRAFYQAFARNVFDSLTARDPNAVVFLESDHSSSSWKWLTDSGNRGQSLTFDDGHPAKPAWREMRIVRVRKQAAIIVHVNRRSALGAPGDALDVATSTQRLVRLDRVAVPTYWSIARPMNHPKRGISCYRTMLLPDPKSGTATPFPPDGGQHQTPNATEFAVLQAQSGDDPDALAAFAQRLRAGVPQARGDVWVRVPSPLFLINKLEEYMP